MSDYTADVLQPLTYGYGTRDRIYVASPAAGANASLVVSRAGGYRLLSVVAKLVTDATAANRWIELDYQTDAGFVYCRNGGAPIITASTTVNVCWKLHMGSSDFASAGANFTPIVYPLSDFLVQQGETLSIVVGNIQATDQLSVIAFTVEEIDEGRRGYPVGRRRG